MLSGEDHEKMADITSDMDVLTAINDTAAYGNSPPSQSARIWLMPFFARACTLLRQRISVRTILL